jgi:sec-independent protein translocase protein TatC
MQHLYELRHRLFLAVLAIFLGAVIGFIWFSVGVPALHIRALGDILTEPYCAVPSPPRVEFAGVDKCQLLATGPFSTLQLRLTAAIMAGFVLTCPFWLYQLWAYVGPALYSKEKRFALAFTGIGAVLFAGGMVLAYLIIPEALKVLLGFGGDFVQAALDPQLYYKFLIGMMLIFGVSLELPLLLVMLNFAGVVKGVKLAKARRYACFGLIVFSGIAVPGNDPISMSVLAATLCVLYEVAVQVSRRTIAERPRSPLRPSRNCPTRSRRRWPRSTRCPAAPSISTWRRSTRRSRWRPPRRWPRRRSPISPPRRIRTAEMTPHGAPRTGPTSPDSNLRYGTLIEW